MMMDTERRKYAFESLCALQSVMIGLRVMKGNTQYPSDDKVIELAISKAKEVQMALEALL